jgi:predicted membrane-bound spermidine synthase
MNKAIFKKYIFLALAFGSGFALMAYELVGARLLFPYIGGSTYVWTSVLSVIIFALAIGYHYGGKIADRRNREVDIAWLHLFAALAVVWTLFLTPPFLEVIHGMSLDPRLAGIIASLFLFVPASVFLGMISPYLVKMSIHSLDTSGSSVAGLSSANAIGSILGTIIIGFVLFGYIGSRESLIILIILLIIMSWMSAPLIQTKKRLLCSIFIIFLGLIFLKTSTHIISIDTALAHYQITEGVYHEKDTRFLITGPYGSQSAIHKDNPNDILFWYAQEIIRAIESHEKKDNILILGGGGYTLSEYLARTYPKSIIDTVEIDPKLIEIAKEYFDYDELPNAHNITGDARHFMNHTDAQYDIVIVDVFSDTNIPFFMVTNEYGNAIKKLLKKDGIALVNVIGAYEGACEPFFDAVRGSYQNYFQYQYASKHPEFLFTDWSNIILLISNQEQNIPGFLTQKNSQTVYYDNFAPIERLQNKCLLDKIKKQK